MQVFEVTGEALRFFWIIKVVSYVAYLGFGLILQYWLTFLLFSKQFESMLEEVLGCLLEQDLIVPFECQVDIQ